ncbi:MAG: hypothetical protein ACKVP0_14255 [Pirellulaceae bacterium]
MRNIFALFSALIFTATVAAGTACAQNSTIQFPRTGSIGTAPATIPPASGSPYGSSIPSYGGNGPITGNAGAGASISAPPASGYAAPPAFSPPATVNTPYSFDPYSTAPGVPNPWSTTPAPATGSFAPPTSPFTTPSSGTFTPPASGSPYINPGAYPSQSSNSVFPNGMWGSNSNAQPFDYNETLRLIQDVRLTETYVGNGNDNDPTDLNINDIVSAVTFAFPNFLGSGQPLFISPTFGIHLWDGPHSIPADLPANAYSAFLDTQYATDPTQQLGAELGFRIGVYSDFNTMNSHSLRIQGLGLGTLKITPTMTLKLGVMYLDRNDIKILPAGGVLWQPSPQVRFDFFFPQPKLASYLTTVNNKEVWWYVAGEYGGGAWTIHRTANFSDRIDINDIRVSIGLETQGNGLNLFGEVGYVFDRRVVYVTNPADSFNPGNAFMVRLGFSF